MWIGRSRFGRHGTWTALAGLLFVVTDLGLTCNQVSGIGTSLGTQVSTLASQTVLQQLPPFVANTLVAFIQSLIALAFSPSTTA